MAKANGKVAVRMKLTPLQAGALYMAHGRAKGKIKELEAVIERAECCLVCAGIADPFEICQNTLSILEEIKPESERLLKIT